MRWNLEVFFFSCGLEESGTKLIRFSFIHLAHDDSIVDLQTLNDLFEILEWFVCPLLYNIEYLFCQKGGGLKSKMSLLVINEVRIELILLLGELIDANERSHVDIHL